MGVGFRVRVAVGNDRYLARSRDEFISLVRTLPRFVSLNGFVSLLFMRGGVWVGFVWKASLAILFDFLPCFLRFREKIYSLFILTR